MAARGNFDRAVISQRVLRSRGYISAQEAYFSAKKAERAGKSTFAEAVKAEAKRGPKRAQAHHAPHDVYVNPTPTVRACGKLLALPEALERL